MRFWPDSDLEIPVRWYFTSPRAPFLPFSHVFGSRNYDEDDDTPPAVGMQTKAKPWRDGSPPPWPNVGSHTFPRPPLPRPIFLTFIQIISDLPIPIFHVGQVLVLRPTSTPMEYASEPIHNPNSPLTDNARLFLFRDVDGFDYWQYRGPTMGQAIRHGGSFTGMPGPRPLGDERAWNGLTPFGQGGLGTMPEGTCEECKNHSTHGNILDSYYNLDTLGVPEMYWFIPSWFSPVVTPPSRPGRPSFFTWLPPDWFPPGFLPDGFFP